MRNISFLYSQSEICSATICIQFRAKRRQADCRHGLPNCTTQSRNSEINSSPCTKPRSPSPSFTPDYHWSIVCQINPVHLTSYLLYDNLYYYPIYAHTRFLSWSRSNKDLVRTSHLCRALYNRFRTPLVHPNTTGSYVIVNYRTLQLVMQFSPAFSARRRSLPFQIGTV